MKKTILFTLSFFVLLVSKSQVNYIDFGNGNTFFSCDPPVYTTTNQIQCSSVNPVSTTAGTSVMYYTTDAGSIGNDCRNWFRLSNPGFSFIGTGSELQMRGAMGGNTIFNPARFLVKNFTPGNRFGITFDIALAGRGGEFLFHCGSGQAYGDTVYMLSRDSSSFMVMKIDDNNPSILQPRLSYSSSAENLLWPNVPSYSFVPGINSIFPVYQKHTVAIFCNNTNLSSSYTYIGTKTLNPQSYDVYLDSVLDVDNMFDNFFGLNRSINSFMISRSSSMCANGGPYLGDTLLVDNIRWTSDFLASPLPVHLSSFTAKALANKSVELKWKDETPEDGVKFQVQVSTDGTNFRSIGQVVEQGSRKDYSFVYPNANCGQLYFRLAFEGKYSDIRTVTIPCDVSLTSDGKNIRIQTKYPGTLTLINSSGQTIARRVLAQGSHLIPVALPAGLYVARFVDTQGAVFVKKIVVQ